jgi:hypothetical protein
MTVMTVPSSIGPKKPKFTAAYNPEHWEWEVYCNEEIFCHLSETDFDIFINYFKLPVKILKRENTY